MNPLRQALRVVKINVVLLRNGLDEIVFDTPLFRPIRFLLYLTPGYWLRRHRLSRGARIRQSLEQLGPIFVKFGQILSTRQDLLPSDIVAELALLQDRVPPFPSAMARHLMETALGQPLESLFAEFDPQPLASASIAQVHAARLRDGREVVIKVVRPNIEKTIKQDVEILYTIAELAERYWSTGKRLRPREVVAEFEKNLFDELDLLREAANASQLRRHFADSPMLYVPDVEWRLTKTNVMVMERIRGIPVNQIQTLAALGVDFKVLAERGVEIFFTQVFRNSFFHADMHPGNIFVDATQPRNPRYIAVDFGIMGSLNPVDQNYLAQNFLAFFNRDYRRVAELHVESGWVPPDTRLDEFEAAIRTVCEPIFERPLHEISFGGLLLRLFQTARRFNMEVQPQLVLLQKTLLNIEGLGRQLYPDLDLWATAKPFLERWMSEQVGVRSVLRRLVKNLPVWGQILPELPTTVNLALQNVTAMQRGFAQQQTELRQLRKQLRRSYQIQSLVLAGCAVLVGEFLLLAQRGEHAEWLNAAGWFHGVMVLLGLVLLLGALPLRRD